MSLSKLAGLLLVLGLVSHGWSAPAGAASLQTTGWWWRAQTGAASVPPPPHVPENGLAVGNAPDGATAVSALRFTLEADEINPVLELVVAENLSGADVELVACPTASPWFGTQAGSWDERPEAACSLGMVAGIASADGGSWTFALDTLDARGPLDVVVLPAEGPGAPFEISFEAPGANSLRTTRVTASSDPEPPPPAQPRYDSFIPPSATFDDGVDTARPLAPLAPDGSSSPETAAPTERREFVNVAAPRQPGTTGDGGDPRPLALVILFSAFVAALAVGREPLPTPRLLGPMATRQSRPEVNEPSETRGVGRFRRPRRGAVPMLR